jgi:hypothetical protein
MAVTSRLEAAKTSAKMELEKIAVNQERVVERRPEHVVRVGVERVGEAADPDDGGANRTASYKEQRSDKNGDHEHQRDDVTAAERFSRLRCLPVKTVHDDAENRRRNHQGRRSPQ